VIVGKKSFGKGVGTVTIQLPDKSAIQVTNFAYYLPNGESVEGVGLEPDYVVEIPKKAAGKPISSMTREEDTQLSKAIELLLP
jgi:carboxyl-terminal processing protease